MKNIHHPSEILSADAIDLIREEATGAEKSGAMTPSLLDLIYTKQWFTLLAPKTYNSPEMALPELVRLEEAISWADGSTGWVVTLCAGASWFGGFLSPSLASAIFSSQQACLAGSGATSGTAERTDDGYIINGKWLHATGSPHATVFTANCIITENNIPVRKEDGSELIHAFIFLKEEVRRSLTWKSLGLVATASNAFEVSALPVASERAFTLHPGSAVIDVPLYKYPFYQLAEATLAANIAGMAIHFLEEAEAILTRKKGAFSLVALPVLKKTLIEMNSARSKFYLALDTSWQEILRNGAISANTLADVTNTSRALAKLSINAVDTVYPYCGLMAASTETTINHVWRDIHTASQHTLLTYPLA